MCRMVRCCVSATIASSLAFLSWSKWSAALDGRMRLLIQLIDFLAMRRRPERGRYFERLLQITPEHREKIGMHDASESAVRERLARWKRKLRTVLGSYTAQ